MIQYQNLQLKYFERMPKDPNSEVVHGLWLCVCARARVHACTHCSYTE